jgi:type II secretory pathway component PulF
MPRFHYRAKQSPTQIVQGEVVAENKQSALEEINGFGFYVLSVEEESGAPPPVSSPASRSPAFFQRVGLKETNNFVRQLADLLESGISMVRALDLLQSQTPNKKLKAAIGDIRDRCVGGSSLSEAINASRDVFPHLFVVLSKAGETGGTLDLTLRRLSIFNEKQLDIRAHVRMALAYPTLMVIVGALTILILLVFVIPRMAGIFEDLGNSLPLPTQILLFVSGLFTRYFVGLTVVLGAVGWASWLFYRTPAGRRWADQVKLELPLFGELTKKVEIARFLQTFATLLENGVSVLESLKVASDTIDNMLLKNELDSCYAAVKGGERLSASLTTSRVIPPIVIQMIGVGEESGRLEKTLQKIAENYERETDQAIKILLSLLEPSLILVLGLVVGFMVIAILLPIFEISLSAK